VVSITLAYVPLDLILPDQPNRAVRTRMLRGGVPWKLHTRWGYGPPRSACRSRSQIAVSCVG